MWGTLNKRQTYSDTPLQLEADGYLTFLLQQQDREGCKPQHFDNIFCHLFMSICMSMCIAFVQVDIRYYEGESHTTLLVENPIR